MYNSSKKMSWFIDILNIAYSEPAFLKINWDIKIWEQRVYGGGNKKNVKLRSTLYMNIVLLLSLPQLPPSSLSWLSPYSYEVAPLLLDFSKTNIRQVLGSNFVGTQHEEGRGDSSHLGCTISNRKLDEREPGNTCFLLSVQPGTISSVVSPFNLSIS